MRPYVSKVIFMVYVQQYTRLQASQSDKDSEMETLRSTQQELDALQAKVRRKAYFRLVISGRRGGLMASATARPTRHNAGVNFQWISFSSRRSSNKLWIYHLV